MFSIYFEQQFLDAQIGLIYTPVKLSSINKMKKYCIFNKAVPKSRYLFDTSLVMPNGAVLLGGRRLAERILVQYWSIEWRQDSKSGIPFPPGIARAGFTAPRCRQIYTG